ncbi:hypothetical protein V473_21430 [Sphingobium cupriresistens LL01]|uniref:Uncharacterized protein n=1 Tax=Sphingobium cupriresistens LL01 TaxID=1420583 RepID=A0A0J7XL72_9SPHN|nr:hypothetical protein V473_21430 [Sphingobium cupriresistens LL01]
MIAAIARPDPGASRRFAVAFRCRKEGEERTPSAF